ncbi:MAG: RIO1 family regulatory kinase/ATPase [Chloroflexota bacterium]
MSRNNHSYNDDFESKYDRMADAVLRKNHSRLVHKANRVKGRKREKPTRQEIVGGLTDENDLIEDFVPTYAAALDPKHFERRWVIGSLSNAYRDKLISDVLYQVKVGKEANVYACTAGEAAPDGVEMIAAKLYRPRMFRHLRNDAAYKIGRLTHNREGKKVRRNSGIERAAKKKTAFGQELEFANWIGHEYRMQTSLFNSGADVPMPLAHSGNTILMDFYGNKRTPASTLNDVKLPDGEAHSLFELIVENIRLMLSMNHVHGDLSAYNILYWQGEIAIIDFPQMVDAAVNPNGQKFLIRDVERVVDYFSPYGVTADAQAISLDLWHQFMDGAL